MALSGFKVLNRNCVCKRKIIKKHTFVFLLSSIPQQTPNQTFKTKRLYHDFQNLFNGLILIVEFNQISCKHLTFDKIFVYKSASNLCSIAWNLFVIGDILRTT